MSHKTDRPLAILQHDAVAEGCSTELLVSCLRISGADDKLLADADQTCSQAWDVVANLNTALHVS